MFQLPGTYLDKFFMVKTSSKIFQPIMEKQISIMRISRKVAASLQPKFFKELTNVTVMFFRTHENQGKWKSAFGNTVIHTNHIFQILMFDIS